MWIHEHNMRVHLIVMCIVVIGGLLFRVSAGDWLSIILAASLVLVTEILNTCVEQLCNLITKERHPAVALIKDLAAAAVLIAALAAAFVGAIVFIPEIVRLWS